ncbi:MAG: DedA family protein [Gemmatimonadota bacterium]
MQEILSFLGGLAPSLVYAVLGAGAALENIFPPIPADTFVFLGGFLAGAGRADAWTVYGVIWVSNVGSALAVYAAGLRYGSSFFQEGLGRYLLDQEHLIRIRKFYDRWGFPAIFLTRFLPGLRAIVPVFAGVSHHPFLPVAVPLALASAVWYGALVWLGATAGRNVEVLWEWIRSTNRVLLVIAVVLSIGVGVWWYRTRREARTGDGLNPERDEVESEREESQGDGGSEDPS